jgi:hypothetical protein
MTGLSIDSLNFRNNISLEGQQETLYNVFPSIGGDTRSKLMKRKERGRHRATICGGIRR